MKLNYVTLLSIGLAFLTDAYAQYVPMGPTIRLNSKGGDVFVPAVNCGNAYMEGPPWVKPGGMRSYYFTTHFSTLFSSNVNLAADNIYQLNMNMNDATVVSCPLTWWNGFHGLATTGPGGTDLQWRRNYQGICSSHSFNYPSRGNVVVAFSHGENKNEIKQQGSTSYYYQNTILPECVLNPNDPTSYSGYDGNGNYVDCDKAYFGFVNLNWTDDVQSNSWGNTYYNEHGPIAWPSNGYVTPDRKKASVGLRHPTSIVHNGYIYIYMLDSWRSVVNNDSPEAGREPGIKLVRAPLASSLNENAYQIYYNGSWVPSLPAGYTRQNMMSFLTTKGPKSSLILGNSNTIRFAVAKVRDMPGYFVGVEELEKVISVSPFVKVSQVVLRLSQDLINWSEPQVILEQKPSHDALFYRYPHFLDQWGWTNTEIDLHKFYILGTSSNSNTVTRVRLDIDILTGLDQGGCFGCKTGGLDSYQENGTLHVTAPERGTRKKVTVHNIFGTLVKQEVVDPDSENFDVNLKELGAAGIYIMTVESENNRYTKKILVQ